MPQRADTSQGDGGNRGWSFFDGANGTLVAQSATFSTEQALDLADGSVRAAWRGELSDGALFVQVASPGGTVERASLTIGSSETATCGPQGLSNQSRNESGIQVVQSADRCTFTFTRPSSASTDLQLAARAEAPHASLEIRAGAVNATARVGVVDGPTPCERQTVRWLELPAAQHRASAWLVSPDELRSRGLPAHAAALEQPGSCQQVADNELAAWDAEAASQRSQGRDPIQVVWEGRQFQRNLS